MYTYIIKSGKYHKIGKAKNTSKRFDSYRTHNPDFTVIKVIEGDYEAFLHNHFKMKKSHLEWFFLEDEDINIIDDIIKSTQPIEEAESYTIYKNTKKKDICAVALFSMGVISIEQFQELMKSSVPYYQLSYEGTLIDTYTTNQEEYINILLD